MDSLQQFTENFSNMTEEEAIAYLTEHVNDLPQIVQDHFGALVLSRALDAQIGKHEIKTAVLAVLEAALLEEEGKLTA